MRVELKGNLYVVFVNIFLFDTVLGYIVKTDITHPAVTHPDNPTRILPTQDISHQDITDQDNAHPYPSVWNENINNKLTFNKKYDTDVFFQEYMHFHFI